MDLEGWALGLVGFISGFPYEGQNMGLLLDSDFSLSNSSVHYLCKAWASSVLTVLQENGKN